MKIKTLIILTIVLGVFASAQAQVASNPPYILDQSVIASGGGQNSTGGTFSLDGTIGQSIAGTTSTNSPFSLTSGFWTAAPFAPTAASVTISGQVLITDGRGLQNAQVIMSDASGNTRTAKTTSFGYYYFDNVEVGQTYIVSINSRRYKFAPQVVSITEEVFGLNFTAVE